VVCDGRVYGNAVVRGGAWISRNCQMRGGSYTRNALIDIDRSGSVNPGDLLGNSPDLGNIGPNWIPVTRAPH